MRRAHVRLGARGGPILLGKQPSNCLDDREANLDDEDRDHRELAPKMWG